jgi:hypothetical protein
MGGVRDRQVWAIFAPKLVWDLATLAAADLCLLVRPGRTFSGSI